MMTSRPGPRRAPTCRPSVEALEDRTVPSTVTGGRGNSVRDVTVLSRNLYVGADLAGPTAALISGNPTAIVQATTQFWAEVQATDFHERAEALADEIQDTRPLLVGLQEVSLFRSGPADSFSASPTPATHVELDYLDILLDELADRGLHYKAVAVVQDFDSEAPAFTANGPRDLRLTDRDVILARSDLPASQLKISNVQAANFATNVTLPVGDTGQSFTVLRGWMSVDAKVRGKTFRFINTHLEPELPTIPQSAAVQLAQAGELLAGPADTDLPVILAGDFNSRADGTGTPTYAALIAAGFSDAWSVTHPGEPGYTWGHDADLLNETVNLTERIDLVLFRGDFVARRADVLGDELADRTASGLWPSDHAGIVATLGLHVRPGKDAGPDPALFELLATELAARR